MTMIGGVLCLRSLLLGFHRHVLVPVWWAGFLLIVLMEEESLGRTLGQPYLDYKQRVKGRIIPGSPI